jgi:HAD superfamily, subfamily IIIB (Acid phosphatase)
MLQSLSSALRRRSVSAVALAAATFGALLLLVPGLAGALSLSQSVPAPPANPTSADEIQNVDQVKTAIKGYYGDTPTSQLDPVAGTVALHQMSPTGAYANEMAGVVADAEKELGKPKAARTPNKAVLFDVDDTTLNTYSYEIYSSFVFNPTTNAAFVNACLTATGCVFPAVPHMVDLEKWAESQGYTVFFLTGRPIAQRPGTVANLTNAGYDVVANNLYLKDASGATEPWLSPCAPTCTTTQYKSLTRAHIESLGYEIVGNFGDQFSDLNGGFADETFKIPNPMYFLP